MQDQKRKGGKDNDYEYLKLAMRTEVIVKSQIPIFISKPSVG